VAVVSGILAADDVEAAAKAYAKAVGARLKSKK
jgi:thiamine monophosphate synthase